MVGRGWELSFGVITNSGTWRFMDGEYAHISFTRSGCSATFSRHIGAGSTLRSPTVTVAWVVPPACSAALLPARAVGAASAEPTRSAPAVTAAATCRKVFMGIFILLVFLKAAFQRLGQTLARNRADHPANNPTSEFRWGGSSSLRRYQRRRDAPSNHACRGW